MTDKTVNVPLLRKAVEWAEAEAAKPPELCEWEQGFYVLPASGDHPTVVKADGTPATWVTAARSGKARECGTCYCVAGFVASTLDVEWRYDTAHKVATEALGLDRKEAVALFEQGNTIEDVRRIAESLAGERL